MKFRFIVILIILGVYSCQTKNINIALIKGDWAGIKDSAGDANKRPVFSFEDSICKLFVPWHNYFNYSIDRDKLKIYQLQGNTNKLIEVFKILKLDGDSMVLYAKNKEDSAVITRLAKIKTQNNIHPSKIYFASSACYGTCPSMFLEIDSMGKLMFYGRSHTDKPGFYSTMLSNKAFNAILKKISNVNLASLERKYEAPWSDDQTCGINIIAGKKEYLTTVYGYNKEPIELRILLYYLMELYQHIDLRKDTLLKENYFLQNPEFKKIIVDAKQPPPPLL